MRINNDELIRSIRPLKWEMRLTSDGRQFYTPRTDNERQLFWVDFARNILAPNLKRQTAILQIKSRTQLMTQPVILDKTSGNLWLPSEIETLMHYARDAQAGPPFRFSFGDCSSKTALATGIITLVLLGYITLQNGRR